MGFWSSLGSVVSSAFSSTVSAVSAVVGTVSSFTSAAVEKIGPAVAKAVSVIGPILAAIPGKIGIFAKVVTGIAQIFDVFKEKDDPEDLGDRGLQAANKGIVREKFDSFDEYMDALRAFDLDEDASRSISKSEKLVIGSSLGVQGLSERLGATPLVVGSLCALATKSPDFFSVERLSKYIDAVGDAETVLEFLKGDLQGEERASVRDSIATTEYKIDPSRSATEGLAELISALRAVDQEESR